MRGRRNADRRRAGRGRRRGKRRRGIGWRWLQVTNKLPLQHVNLMMSTSPRKVFKLFLNLLRTFCFMKTSGGNWIYNRQKLKLSWHIYNKKLISVCKSDVCLDTYSFYSYHTSYIGITWILDHNNSKILCDRPGKSVSPHHICIFWCSLKSQWK